ncbi:MAG: nucleotidyltransferase family protein [Thermoflexales bacterium]|nr:nucleotidyltransferase family protein [Thermoflexales bacterium]
MTLEMEHVLILPDTSIGQAIARIDRNHRGIVLVVRPDQQLLGTITDGDVRRAMLAGLKLDTPVSALLTVKAATKLKPVTALAGTPADALLALMRQHSVRQIPLLNESGQVVDLVTLDELLPRQDLLLQAVIMAGGQGTRLRPLTEDLPKPMLPVGGRPLMERIVQQLQQAGIRRVNVTTHYKPEKIIEYFGDGHAFGVDLNYVNEDRPLGTGGALGLMPQPTEPVLVINGDILTQVDFRAMLDFHQENKADLTIAVRRYEVPVPYGVIECDGPLVQHLREKPQVSLLVNAGIYLLEPTVFQFIPQGQHFNMTDLIQWLLDAQRIVASFPVHEYWLDIGQHADYAQAQSDSESGKVTP